MRTRVAFAVCVPLMLALLPAYGAHAATAVPDAAPAARTLTLVTGDRVTLTPRPDGRPGVAVTPAHWPGRRVDFRTSYGAHGVRVVPSDVARLVPAVLDPRLFEVSELIRAGYDDGSTATLPLIVHRGPIASVRPLRTVRELPSIAATAMDLPKSGAAGLGAALAATVSTGERVWLDERVHATDVTPVAGPVDARLDANLTRIGAPSAWAAGLSGTGVRVAVLDTGVDAGHPDLAGRVAAAQDFTGGTDATDHNGHGTHVASLLAGSGAAAAGARKGVAFGATLLSGKVLDDNGTGQFSAIIAGMEWAAAQGARVVNMSLGADIASNGTDPLSLAVNGLTESRGVLFVTSAGNRGPAAGTIAAPGAADAALTVGAVDDKDRLADFSSRGPRAGDYAIKPDLVAPGVEIVGARAAGTSLGTPVDANYTRLSGTSMAAPQVAGAAALLAQEHPQWTAGTVKAALIASAAPTGNAAPVAPGPFEAGSGRVDLTSGIGQILVADPPALGFGLVAYPQAALPPLERPVALVNTGAGAVTLTLRAQLRTADGLAAPDGMLAVTPARVTVPAGGSASVTATLAVAMGGTGTFQGTITGQADGGSDLVRIPVAVVNEATRHLLHIHAVDRNGTAQVQALATVLNLTDLTASPPDPVLLTAGEATVRVPPGFYTVTAAIPTVEEGGGGPDTFTAAQVVTSVTIATVTDVGVDADTDVVLDARTGQPLSASVAAVPTTPVDVQVAVAAQDQAGNGFVLGYATSAQDVVEGRLFVEPTEPVRHGRLELASKWRLDNVDNGQTYDLLFAGARFPSSLAYLVQPTADGGLARVDTTYRAPAAPVGYREARFAFTDVNPVSVAVPQPLPGSAPARRTEYLTSGAGQRWFQCVTLTVADAGIGSFCQPPAAYLPQARDERSWLRAPLRTTVSVARAETALLIGMDDLADDDAHAGSIAGFAFAERAYTLSRNGIPLDSGVDPIGVHEVPPGNASFRLTRTLVPQPGLLPLSSRVESSWTFASSPPEAGRPPTAAPVVDVSVRVPVDAGNAVPAAAPLTLEMAVRHPAAPVSGAGLQLSTDDGLTWLSLDLQTAGDGIFRATLPAGRLTAGSLVSLRATAADTDGNHTEQTVLRAFAVA
jgi:subtilisin family serine protease